MSCSCRGLQMTCIFTLYAWCLLTLPQYWKIFNARVAINVKWSIHVYMKLSYFFKWQLEIIQVFFLCVPIHQLSNHPCTFSLIELRRAFLAGFQWTNCQHSICQSYAWRMESMFWILIPFLASIQSLYMYLTTLFAGFAIMMEEIATWYVWGPVSCFRSYHWHHFQPNLLQCCCVKIWIQLK